MSIPIQARQLRGGFAAMITPKFHNGDIDYEKTDTLIEDFVRCGTGIVAAGTTGESDTLDRTEHEHEDFVEYVHSKVAGRVPFMAGAGSNSTEKAVRMVRELEKRIGPATFLSKSPYGNKPTQNGIILHYAAIADALNEPESNIVLYNVPSRTARNVEAATALRLAENPRIIGVKECPPSLPDGSPDMGQPRQIAEGAEERGLDFVLGCGEDGILAEMLSIGGRFGVSATANICPRIYSSIFDACEEGKYDRMQEIQQRLNPLVSATFFVTSPIPLATAFNSGLRLPLCRENGVEENMLKTLSDYSAAELGIDLTKYNEKIQLRED